MASSLNGDRSENPQTVHIAGGGLAGSEAAWQLAERGHRVVIHEMRPLRVTPAHRSDRLAELVCSNTFKSTETSNAHGLLKAEMRALGSLILRAADEARVPGGSALAVDREVFAATVDRWVTAHPRIEVVRDEVTELPSPGIVATGPLTSDSLSVTIQERLGVESLAFYDAIAPIVAGESIDASIVFRASRYGKETMSGADAVAASGASDLAGEGAYVNCPFTREQYEAFLDVLIAADQYEGHDFDPIPYFEGCMPVEEMARRGRETLRFGPMKPVGLRDPRTGREAYAIAQLRMEDRGGRMWNLVGFQTRLRTREQQRVFRMIPGPRGRGVPALGFRALQLVRERGGGPNEASVASRRSHDAVRGPADGGGGLHRELGDGAARRHQPRASRCRRASGDPAADDHARRAVPVSPRG